MNCNKIIYRRELHSTFAMEKYVHFLVLSTSLYFRKHLCFIFRELKKKSSCHLQSIKLHSSTGIILILPHLLYFFLHKVWLFEAFKLIQLPFLFECTLHSEYQFSTFLKKTTPIQNQIHRFGIQLPTQVSTYWYIWQCFK